MVIAALSLAGLLYLLGAAAVRRRHPSRPWPWWRTAGFLSGLAVVAVATMSAVGGYDDVLFADHMVQHLLLIMIAPPLLVYGRPVMLAMHSLRGPGHRVVRTVVRSRVAGVLTAPPVGFAVYAAAVIGTHLTSFMDLTVRHPLVHDAEHLLYLVAGYLFFLPLLGSEPIRWRLSYPARFLLLALAMPVDTFVGVVLGQEGRDPFGAYVSGRPGWAGSALGDLHAGGALMWVAGDAVMLGLMLVVFVAFLRDGRAAGSAGPWLESVRRNTFAEHLGRAGVAVVPQPARRTGTIDSDADLAAYNAYLAALARNEKSSPG